MKKILTLFAFMALLNTACQPDKCCSPPGSARYLIAQKDNVQWSAANVTTGFKPLATKDTLFIVAQNGEENIVIAIKQKGTGSYKPDEFKAYFYTTVGLDAVVSKYQLADNPANSITITIYDESANVLKATFNLDFKSTYKNNNSLPDEIKFTNGSISAQLSDVFIDPYK